MFQRSMCLLLHCLTVQEKYLKIKEGNFVLLLTSVQVILILYTSVISYTRLLSGF